MNASIPEDAPMPQPPKDPPSAPAAHKILRDNFNQTDTAQPKLTVSRSTSYPPMANFPSSSNQGPPPDPPKQITTVKANPLGPSAEAYLMHNFISAQTQHNMDQKLINERNGALLKLASQSLGTQTVNYNQNTLLRQALIANLIDNRQSAS